MAGTPGGRLFSVRRRPHDVGHEGSNRVGVVMTLLLQQELLEPTPTRRIIVAAGHESWWGVDPSTTRVAIAWVHGATGSRGVRTVPFALGEGASRLAEIHRTTTAIVHELLDGAMVIERPGLVLVEQPSGSNQQVNLPLIYAVGVIQAAIYEALLEETGRVVQMETCTSSWWKKRACGRGNLYKPSKRRPGDGSYPVLTWARENGYGGLSWDEADAWGIAEAARRDVALEPR